MRTLSALVTTLTLGVLMAACSSQPDPTAQNVEASVSTQVADSIMTLDEQFLAISKQVPEFAGLYRGKAGEVVARVVPSSNIHLGDQAAANEVRDAIVAVMGTEVFTGQPDAKGATGSTELPIEAAVANNTLSVSLIAATYSFEELHQWFSQVIDLDLEGQMILDANEGKNKVYVGVETDVQADKARIRIAEVGIPANAFEVRAVGPFDDLVSQSNINQKSEAGDIAGSQTNLAPAAVQYLTDSYNSPLVGGVRIRRPDGAGCTYGFSVRRAGRLGFVTNSHCTQQKFAPDGISLKQGGSVIGSEAADPLPFLCSSSSVPWCRFSDSAFIATNGTRPVLGRIANVGPAYQDKSYDISLLVHGTLWYTRQYEEYWAASAFTGYNRLIILNTCTRLSTFGSTVAIDCGAVAGYPAGYGAAIGGDSGSPVYARTTRGARLVGQIFGGNPLFDNTWLNNSGGIWKDLGDLEYFLP